MQQSITQTLSLPKSQTALWGRIGVLFSVIGLAAVFALSSTTSIGDFFSSSPQAPQTAGGGGTIANKSAQSTAVSDVVTKALAFKAMLTTTQQATLEQTYTPTLARKWSNLPCGNGCRNGIQFGTLTNAQFLAAQEVIKAALSTSTNTDGFAEWEAIRIAEAYLKASGGMGGNGYDSTLRWIAFLNTPSDTGAWMLQMGGHHYAANIGFKGGRVIGGTPYFMGLEPKSFTYNGTAYAPLNDEQNALAAMMASLSATQLTSAKITGQSFSDCYMIPGESNGGQATFPAKTGVMGMNLTGAQKALILAAIKHYTDDIDTSTGYTQYAEYASEIDSTYVSYVGSGTAGSASSFLVAQGDYVRIDGPHVWIEFSCQGGVVIQGQIHYHTVWRDHSHDYGVDLTGAPIDATPTAVSNVKTGGTLNVYPNPASGQVSLSLSSSVKNGTLAVMTLNGQMVKRQTAVNGSDLTMDVSDLAKGNYILRVEDASGVYTARFSKF